MVARLLCNTYMHGTSLYYSTHKCTHCDDVQKHEHIHYQVYRGNIILYMHLYTSHNTYLHVSI